MPRKLFIAFVLTLLLGLLAIAIGTWWWFLIVAAVIGFGVRARHPSMLFWTMLIAGAAAYALGGLWFSMGDGDLPARIAEIFKVGSAGVLLLVTSIVGGLSAGLFGALGAYLRVVLQGKPEKVVIDAVG
ncbi:MAG: hypothetical protein AB8F78_06310 [Saprospiraceae bacterium]